MLGGGTPFNPVQPPSPLLGRVQEAAAHGRHGAVLGLQLHLEWAVLGAHSEGPSPTDPILPPRVGMELAFSRAFIQQSLPEHL